MRHDRSYILPNTVRVAHLTAALFAAVAVAPAHGQCYTVKGKISRNFYRIPYANGEQILAGSEYFTHGGAMDIVGQPAAPPDHVIVAAANGVIEGLDDSHNECGFHGTFCCCVNWIGVRHANNEISRYYHLRQGSATSLGLAPGQIVLQGQMLGREGDVGITGGTPGSSPPRTGPCAPAIPPDYPAGVGCQDHLHFAVLRVTNSGTASELMVPMTCNIPWNVYTDDTTYTAEGCQPPIFCIGAAQTYGGVTLSGLGTARVYQNADAITANTFVVQNQASVVFRATHRVRLTPGFHAGTGDSYFRAEVGACNVTAPGATSATYMGPIPCAAVGCPVVCP